MAKKDYAHIRDEESERTRAELWIIIAIVVVVVIGALVFRAVKHKPAGPPADSNITINAPTHSTPAAAAGVSAPHPPPPTPKGY